MDELKKYLIEYHGIFSRNTEGFVDPKVTNYIKKLDENELLKDIETAKAIHKEFNILLPKTKKGGKTNKRKRANRTRKNMRGGMGFLPSSTAGLAGLFGVAVVTVAVAEQIIIVYEVITGRRARILRRAFLLDDL
jgi:hypothetical protein